MKTTLDKLIYMANQIATAFRHQQHDQAVEATFDHLWHFWDPRMRAMIINHAEGGGEGLNPVARAAVARLAHAAREPRSVTYATEFTKAGETDVADDAG